MSKKNSKKILKCPDDVDRRTCRPKIGATTHANLRVVLDLARPKSKLVNKESTRLRECDCAARAAQTLPAHLRVGEGECEVGRDALLAHTGFDVSFHTKPGTNVAW